MSYGSRLPYKRRALGIEGFYLKAFKCRSIKSLKVRIGLYVGKFEAQRACISRLERRKFAEWPHVLPYL